MQPRKRSYTPSRRLYYLLLFSIAVLLWRWTNGWHRFLCATSTKPPSTSLEDAASSQSPPTLHNPHEPLIVESPTIEYLNLDNASFTSGAADRVLILTPLRDASSHLETYFKLLQELTYPHQSIDLAFLVGDCKDDTLDVLQHHLKQLQAASNPTRYRSAMIIEKDFGDNLPQSVEYRHSFEAQGPRRKGIGRSRNYLLYAALKPEHKWVYWRDVDIVENPVTVIEDLMSHDRDIIVPNIWFHRIGKRGEEIEGRYDYNSWQESWRGRRLRSRLDKNVILAEGYAQHRTHRTYLAWRAHTSTPNAASNTSTPPSPSTPSAASPPSSKPPSIARGSISHRTRSKTRLIRKGSRPWRKGRGMGFGAYRIMSFGMLIRRRRRGI
ncbi:hypothetical protein XPA_009847 [Xanthoria parietina]